MSAKDYLASAAENVAAWAATGTAGGVVWLIRRVLTNQKQIELLQQELKARDEMRLRDREDMAELKTDMKETRQDIRRLFNAPGGGS